LRTARRLAVLTSSTQGSPRQAQTGASSEWFTRAACYRWLGKTLAVLTDGEFARTGCPQLVDEDARRECRAGARRLDEPLVTFS
jgi:hypothetical protein